MLCCSRVQMCVFRRNLGGGVRWGGGVCSVHAFSVHLDCEALLSMLGGMYVRLQSLVGQRNINCRVNYRPYYFPTVLCIQGGFLDLPPCPGICLCPRKRPIVKKETAFLFFSNDSSELS